MYYLIPIVEIHIFVDIHTRLFAMKHLIFIISLLLISSCDDCKTNNNQGNITLEDTLGNISETEKVEVVDNAIKQTEEIMKIDKLKNLTIYYPNFNSIEFVCKNSGRPDKNDTSIIFCASAAFTGKEYQKPFEHSIIAGNHISNGVFYEGYRCKLNTGCFAFYNDRWNFYHKDYNKFLHEAANNGGMAFAQNMIIYNGKTQEPFRTDSHYYRALCELNHKLCIIDSKGSINYKTFISLLEQIGVSNALYLDMGGWRYSWYRDNKGNVREIHSVSNGGETNWIVFKNI